MKIAILPQAVNVLKSEDDQAVTMEFGDLTGAVVEVGPFPADVWAKFLEIANDPEGAMERAQAAAKLALPGARVLRPDGRKF